MERTRKDMCIWGDTTEEFIIASAYRNTTEEIEYLMRKDSED